MTFRLGYFIATILLFFTEVLIAMYVHDDFFRPYVGDVLVVILLYCFARAFFKIDKYPTALNVLIFSFLIELLQYLNFIQIVGLQDFRLARTVFGTSFSWWDILCYTIGVGLILIFEWCLARKNLELHNSVRS